MWKARYTFLCVKRPIFMYFLFMHVYIDISELPPGKYVYCIYFKYKVADSLAIIWHANLL